MQHSHKLSNEKRPIEISSMRSFDGTFRNETAGPPLSDPFSESYGGTG